LKWAVRIYFKFECKENILYSSFQHMKYLNEAHLSILMVQLTFI